MPLSYLFSRFFCLAVVLLCMFANGRSAHAAGAVRVDAVELELVASPEGRLREATLQLGLRIKHDPHWHTYWRNPGDSGLPTQIQWQLPAGWKARDIAWPQPQRIPVGPLANYGYEGELVLPITMALDASAWHSKGEQKIVAKVSWLMCKDVCIPGEVELELLVVLNEQGVLRASVPTATSSAAQSLLAEALAFAPLAASDNSAWQGTFTLLDAKALVLLPGPALQARLKQAKALEFFPYEEGVVKPSASQALLRLPSGEFALHMLLQENVPERGWPKILNGVLKTGGADLAKPLLVQWSAGDLPVPPGAWSAILEKPVSVASVVAPLAVGSGLRERLSARPSAPISTPAMQESAISLWTAAAFALLGGVILNLMPCVFPVLSLKVMALSSDAASPRQARRHGLLFSLGVISSFLALATVMLVLRDAGQSLGWGFQLQSPLVVSLLSLLFLAIGLNFFGLFEVGLSLTRVSLNVSDKPSSSSAWNAYLSGFLAAIVAAPCSAPFMGSAIGYTLDQSTVVTLLVFALVGCGMAAPYLVLSWWPNLLARLPKPGAWMETLKHFLAFPMLLTAVWLAWVLGALLGNDAQAALSVAAVALAFSLWQYGRWQHGRSRFGLALAVLGLCAATWIVVAYAANDKKNSSLVDESKLNWLAFDAQVAEQHVAAGKTVFVDFTAAWCISCQANKALVLDSKEGRRLLAASHIVLMRADWTRRDAAITKALASYGRNGVPVYLVLAPNKAPVLLPELLTVQLIRESLQSLQ